VPDTLIPPPLNLTLEQEFYAGAYLIGTQLLNADKQCSVTVTRELPSDRTVPYVLYTPGIVAEHMVLQRNLVPVFTNPASPGVPWVKSQSPAAGDTVSAGSEVRMVLQNGPIP
jgi:hypothetical protein